MQSGRYGENAKEASFRMDNRNSTRTILPPSQSLAFDSDSKDEPRCNIWAASDTMLSMIV